MCEQKTIKTNKKFLQKSPFNGGPLSETSLKESPFIIGFMGGIFGGFILLLIESIWPARTPDLTNTIAVLDTQKIIRDRAKSLATHNQSQEEIVADQIAFIKHLDDAVSQLFEEKKVILLKPEAVAILRLPDYTDEIIHRIHLLEKRDPKS